MKQEQQVHIQKSKDALSYYRQMQRLYAASCGGYLGIRECDDTYNDWNRKIIDAYRERYGAAYLGRSTIVGTRDSGLLMVLKASLKPIPGSRSITFAVISVCRRQTAHWKN